MGQDGKERWVSDDERQRGECACSLMEQCCCGFGLVRMLVRVVWLFVFMGILGLGAHFVEGKTRRVLLDTDMDTDDFFAILYLLKQKRSLIDLQAITINTNAWTDAGHAVNQLYDILYMMNRDDISVGVGGEGGILENGTILSNVGGYLPLIEQGTSTFGDCRYRQAIPIGKGGRLDVNTNYGIRRDFLPQGNRKYSPLRQPTAQQVMIDAISAGPMTLLITGGHTNVAIFLMSNPHLKKNIEHIYVMGGGVRSKNPTGCCPDNASSCTPQQCGDHGNLFTGYNSNPYAEFNIFGDPFAAHQVIHSGIPVTLVPLDATNTIPIDENFFMAFEKQQNTYEAQYCFQSLKMARDTWFDDQFYTSYFMWDSFTSGVAISIMLNGNVNNGENEFAEMEYINITVVTSNKPYGIYDGSNPLFDGLASPKFDLQEGGVHSGHVQMGLQDPFCLPDNKAEKGKCEDGYTKEVNGSEDAVRVLVAQKAKPNKHSGSLLDREFFKSFLDDLNLPLQSGRFNFTTQFPYYREVLYKPDFTKGKLGRPVIFDMDMSAGDFISLIYLLKVPVDIIDLKGIFVSGNGWANAATIDLIYDVLHMMGRDDIPVGLGSVTPLENPFYSCKYVRHIPHGSGGLLDSDTLYGFARNLPRSPRRYTAHNSIKYGAPRNTDHPDLRQPSAMEVWQSVLKAVHSNRSKKITILTNGPLTNLANIIRSDKSASSIIQSVYIVGGHITMDEKEKGNIFTFPSNQYSEFNLFLDPVAAKTVIESELDIILIPLSAQRRVSSFHAILGRLQMRNRTPELSLVLRLLSMMYRLQQESNRYSHVEMFLGEVLGSVVLAGDPLLKTIMKVEPASVLAGDITKDGQIAIDKIHGKPINILYSLDSDSYYEHFASTLGNKAQSAVIGSFDEQKRQWSPPHRGNEKGQ
ncbi:hypothetical protein Taro_037651 [Colocasia esculenta]|uniref:Inosine/uridine-preferring nucleoside hydrolase domain-containing protein n=1 Tax=Colocasia esculenta TaxID=4460 RepID=A0A843WLC6_COLES|nr:hypothetical protein [Colocasia esculenta]